MGVEGEGAVGEEGRAGASSDADRRGREWAKPLIKNNRFVLVMLIELPNTITRSFIIIHQLFSPDLVVVSVGFAQASRDS